MAIDLATVGVEFKVDGEHATARVFSSLEQASQRLEQQQKRTNEQLAANASVQQKVQASADALARAQKMAAYEADLSVKEYIAAEQSLRKMGLTSEQVAVSLQRMGFSAAQAAEAAKVQATATSQAASVATGSAGGFGRMRESMTSLAIAASGIPGPIGRVVSAAGNLAIGSAVTIAVVGGVAAIGAAFRALTADSRELKQASDELNQSLDQAIAARFQREHPVEHAKQQLQDLVRQQQEILDKIATEQSHAGERPLNQSRLDSYNRELLKIGEHANEVAQQASDAFRRVSDDAAREAERAAREARRLTDERLKQVSDLASAEAAAVTANADLARDAAAKEQAIQAQARLELEQRIRGMDRLTADEKERLRVAGEAIIAAEAQDRADKRAEETSRRAAQAEQERLRTAEQRAQQLAKLAKAEADLAAARAQAGGNPAEIEATSQQAALVAISEQVRQMDDLTLLERVRLTYALLYLDATKKQLAEQKKQEEEAKARYEAALRQATESLSRGFEQVFANGLEGFDSFFQAVVQLAEKAAASIAATMTLQALGIDKLLKNLTGPGAGSYWKPGEGFKGDGAFAANALAGAGAGYFGGQLTGSGFGGAVTGAAGGFALGGPVGAIVGGVTGLISGLTSAAEKARRLEQLRKQFQQNLDDFVAAATGANQGLAGAVREVQKNADNLRDQLKGSYGPFTGLPGYGRQLDKINAAEEQRIANLEKETKLLAQQTTEDLQVRALRAQGLDDEAAALQLRLNHEREWLTFEKQLGEFFDEDFQRQLKRTQALEDQALATEQANKAAEKAAEIAKYNAQLTEDLNVRLLRAQGKNDEADNLQRQLDHQREVDQALADGASEATIALIKQVQAAEDLALAQQKASDAAQKLIDSINAEARATQDLELRHLRATGATEAADVAAQLYQQRLERQAAIEQGFSQAYLAQLDKVQAEERAFADQQRQAQQQAALDAATQASVGASFLSDSRTTVNLAVGVSESTAASMVGIMRSQITYLASLPRMETTLNRIDGRLAGFSRRGFADAFDEGLGIAQTDANTAAGVPASNR